MQMLQMPFFHQIHNKLKLLKINKLIEKILFFQIFLLEIRNTNPNKPNFDRYDPGINSSPNGPVNLPYQFDLNPNKSFPKPSLDV